MIAWPMVLKRSLSNWKLFSSVVLGVLLASAVMAGTVIFFTALREIALQDALEKIDEHDADIIMQSEKGPTNIEEYEKISRRVDSVVDGLISPYISGVETAGKSATFFLTLTGDELMAGKDNRRSFVAYVSHLESRIQIVGGVSVSTPTAKTTVEGIPIFEAIAPLEEATALGMGTGSRVSLVPYWDDRIPHMIVEIVGVFERIDHSDPSWALTDRVLMASTGEGFATLPLYMDELVYMETVGVAFNDLVSTYAWRLDTDLKKINASNATNAKVNIDHARRLLGSELNRYIMRTELDDSLKEYDTRLLFTKLQMFVVLVMIALVVLYYVATISSLVVEQRRFEVSQLRSRGASSSQILAVFILEGGTMAVISSFLGPLLAAVAIGLLGFTPSFTDLGEGGFLTVRITKTAYVMSALGGLLSFVALMIPAFQASRISVTTQRSESNRPTQKPFVQRYYLDVGFLIVGMILFRQLTEQGSMAARGVLGDVVVNQLLLAVPGVILIAAAMVILRLFPVTLNLITRLFSSQLPAGVVLGLWHMSRNPANYARLALLLTLMTGLGIFAASFDGTLDRSFRDRTLYSIGSDIRLDSVQVNTTGVSRPIVEGYERLEGVLTVSPAFRGTGSDITERFSGNTFTLLGIDPNTFADVAVYRDDFSEDKLTELLATMEQENMPQGIKMPDNARTLGVLVKVDRARPSVALAARVRDANGRYFTYWLGMLDSTNWNLKEVELFGSRRPQRQLFPSGPLTLMSISIVETNGQRDLSSGSILMDTVKVRTATGEVENIEDFRDIEKWQVLKNVPGAERDRIEPSAMSTRGDGSLLYAWSNGSPLTARGVYSGLNPGPIPAIASRSFLKETGHSIGDDLSVTFAGKRSQITVVNSFDYFPTLNTVEDTSLVVAIEPALVITNIGALTGTITPNEMWMSLNPELSEAAWSELATSFEDGNPFRVGNVLDTKKLLYEANIDPLVKAGWRALLLMAFGSILILSVIGFLSHAYVSFRNREVQFALMRTIGISMNQLVCLMLLEQALIIFVGMSLGTWMGGRLGAAIMPFLGSDDHGGQVVPPFIMEVNWSNVFNTYVAMALIFAIVIVGVIFLIRKMSLNRALRLGEL